MYIQPRVRNVLLFSQTSQNIEVLSEVGVFAYPSVCGIVKLSVTVRAIAPDEETALRRVRARHTRNAKVKSSPDKTPMYVHAVVCQ